MALSDIHEIIGLENGKRILSNEIDHIVDLSIILMDVIDHIPTSPDNKPAFYITFKVYCLIAISLIILNVTGYSILGYYQHDEPINETILTYLLQHLISFPIASFLLAVVFAAVPFKGKSYREKYVPMALFILLLIIAIVCMSVIDQLVILFNQSEGYRIIRD